MTRKTKTIISKTILTAILAVIGLLNIFPFIFMLSSSFKPLNEIFAYPISLIPETFILTNYIDVFSDQYTFLLWYGNTLVTVTLKILIKLFIVSITAYAFAKLRFKGRDLLFLILLSSMMIPADAVIIPKYVIFKFLGVTDTMWSLILPAVFDVFFVFMLRQFFISIPESLSEAAIIDGCNHFKIYYRIILPLAGPAIITMVMFTFIWSWNDYMSPYIFITDPNKQMISVGLKMFQVQMSVDYGLLMAGTTLVLIPVFLLFLFAQRYFVQGVATSGMKN